jgi:hypothetical protein
MSGKMVNISLESLDLASQKSDPGR